MGKRILNIVLALVLAVGSHAQTQQGFVRTMGTVDRHGTSLPGATIKIAGGHNSAVSDKDGKFGVPMPGMKDGEAYHLLNVVKSGYEFADKEFVGRTFAFSQKVPLEIVMVSMRELAETQQAIEGRVYASVQQKYTSRMQALESQYKISALSEEDYRTQLQQLQRQFDTFEPLVAAMAEHYARTDFDRLDSLDAEINRCIMSGDIARADILIAQKGSLDDRIAAYRRQLAAHTASYALLDSLSEELKRRQSEYEAEREDIGNDLYHKYSIALAQFNPQSAGMYITLRAELDTTNIDDQLEAGAFMLDYLTDFKKAEAYYERALREAQTKYGRESSMVSYCLNHLGGLFLQKSQFKEALACRREALEIRKKVLGEHHTGVAACYNNLANIYYRMEQFDEGKVCADSAIIVYEQNCETNLSDLADAYTTKGGIELAKGNLAEALLFYERSIAITDSIYGVDNSHSATTINNIGIIKDYMGQREDAVRYYKRSLALYAKLYGERHPNVATVYSNLGTLYQDMGMLDSAMVCQNKALEMRLALFGGFHDDVAVSLNNTASVYSSMKQYESAVDYYKKALAVLDVVVGKTIRYATTLKNIGVVYCNQRDYLSAIDYFDEALGVYMQYAELARKEIVSLVKLEKKCYEVVLADESFLDEEERNAAQHDYEKLIEDYKAYLDAK